MSIRELRYKGFRCSFIVDGHKLYLFTRGWLEELLIRFVRMSKKHDQQQTIDAIKQVLEKVGAEGFHQ